MTLENFHEILDTQHIPLYDLSASFIDSRFPPTANPTSTAYFDDFKDYKL